LALRGFYMAIRNYKNFYDIQEIKTAFELYLNFCEKLKNLY